MPPITEPDLVLWKDRGSTTTSTTGSKTRNC